MPWKLSRSAASRSSQQPIDSAGVKPMPSWSFKVEWEVFDGVKIITAGHVDMKEIVFDPNRGVCCAIVRFDIHGFKPFGDLIIHYFICEA